MIKQKSETGAVLLLVGLLLVVIVLIVAVTVDLSRESLSITSAQKVADATALAAVRQLNGTIAGWNSSRAAAMVALEGNKIEGAGSIAGLALNNPGADNFGLIGEINGVEIEFARGIMWYEPEANNGNGAKTFVSLEFNAQKPQGPWDQEDFDAMALANALKVRVTIKELRTSGFGAAAGVKSIDNLTATSIAVSDSQADIPVAPLAIPFCQLMLDTDPSRRVLFDRHMLLEYDPALQLGRELIFTELAGFDTGEEPVQSANGLFLPTHTPARREGFRRYLSNVHPTLVNYAGRPSICHNQARVEGADINCKELPIQGLLGIAAKDQGYLTVPEFTQFITDMTNGQQFNSQIGMHFKPLATWSPNENENIAAANAMQSFMDSGETTIKDEFTTVDSTNGNIYARRSFPAVRTRQDNCDDLDFQKRPCTYPVQATGNTFDIFEADPNRMRRLVWPQKVGGSPTLLSVLTQDQPPGSLDASYLPFTNPMCNNSTQSLNSGDAPVRQVLAMVISPSVDSGMTANKDSLGRSRGASYCDFGNLFRRSPQYSRIPWADNEPRIVGVVPVNLVGFNFRNLDQQFPISTPSLVAGVTTATPIYADPSVAAPIDPHLEAQRAFDEEQLAEAEERDPNFTFADLVNPSILHNAGQAGALGVSTLEFSDVHKASVEAFHAEYEECFARDQPVVEPTQPGGLVRMTECGQFAEYADENAGIVPAVPGGYVPPDFEDTDGDLGVQGNFYHCFGDGIAEFDAAMRLFTESILDPINGCVTNYKPDGSGELMLGHSEREFSSDCVLGFKEVFDDAIDAISSDFEAVPNTHCVPLPARGAFNLTSDESFQPIHPLVAGMGCGGVRGRINVEPDGDEPILLRSGRTWSEMSPILYEEGR